MTEPISEIASLLNRLAAVEARLAALEARQTVVIDASGTVTQSPLGKDTICSYCGNALWVCRGVHSVC